MVTSVDARKCVGKRLLSDDIDVPHSSIEDEPESKKLMINNKGMADTTTEDSTALTTSTVSSTSDIALKHTKTETSDVSSNDSIDVPMIDAIETVTTAGDALVARRIGNIVGERRALNP